jgi:2-polyprenyl-3-methyl-5-hydroxy-6-metoxy-1,4-benzoquinol methylase
MEKNSEKCISCNKVMEFRDIHKFKRVSSDVRSFKSGFSVGECLSCGLIQKLASQTWHRDAKEIYSNYRMFHQSTGGAEQQIFDEKSQSNARSEKVINSIKFPKYFFEEPISILDIGCGNGPTLNALSKKLTNANLFGFDLTNINEKNLKEIINFKGLYTGSVDKIKDKFDLIVMFHSLEHMPDPSLGLKLAFNRLNANGILLIQVPNIATNFYDLLVADHLTHFDKNSLSTLIQNSIGSVKINNPDILFKELTFVISKGKYTIHQETLNQNLDYKTLSYNFLDQVILSLEIIKKDANIFFAQNKGYHLGIFGTSIAATWLASEFDSRVNFFVDEDISRIGNTHQGKNIYGLSQIQEDWKIFLPPMSTNDTALMKRLDRFNVNYYSVSNNDIWRQSYSN